MRPFIEELSRKASCFVSIYPNAGLPNEMGGYDETADMMSGVLSDLCRKRIYKYCRRLLRHYS
jgi:5-methyltetrahydrofolate--homocysteine methyltransferase